MDTMERTWTRRVRCPNGHERIEATQKPPQAGYETNSERHCPVPDCAWSAGGRPMSEMPETSPDPVDVYVVFREGRTTEVYVTIAAAQGRVNDLLRCGYPARAVQYVRPPLLERQAPLPSDLGRVLEAWAKPVHIHRHTVPVVTVEEPESNFGARRRRSVKRLRCETCPDEVDR